MARVTMKDIAQRAGISQQAVSQIINKKDTMVSKATRERVLELVKELNYTPNYMAQSLRSGKRFCIGVAGTGRLSEMDDLTITRIYSGIGEVVEEQNYYLMFIPLGPDNLDKLLVRAAKSGMVDGLIIMVYSSFIESFDREIGRVLKDENIPYVAIHSTSHELSCPNVGYDAVAAGRMAGRHLAEYGYSTVGTLGAMVQAYNSQLKEGFKQAASEAGMHIVHHPMENRFYSAEAGYLAGKDVVSRGMFEEAYFVASDAHAYGFIRALEEAGKRVPEDIGVIGVDNMLNEKQMYSHLTTVDRCFAERGKIACEMLFDIMQENNEMERRVIVEPELIIRNTTRKQ